MIQSSNIRVMSSALLKVAKILRRDFSELEKIQNSKQNVDKFVLKSIDNVKESINIDLIKARPEAELCFVEDGLKIQQKDFFFLVDPAAPDASAATTCRQKTCKRPWEAADSDRRAYGAIFLHDELQEFCHACSRAHAEAAPSRANNDTDLSRSAAPKRCGSTLACGWRQHVPMTNTKRSTRASARLSKNRWNPIRKENRRMTPSTT